MVKCDECGSTNIKVNDDIVLLSNPPKYQAICLDCDNKMALTLDEVNSIKQENDILNKVINDIKEKGREYKFSFDKDHQIPIDINIIYPNYVEDLTKYLNKCIEAFNQEVKKQLPKEILPLNLTTRIYERGEEDVKGNDQ